VIPVARLRFVGFSHHEADESGALNDFLAVAHAAQPVCSQIGAMTSIGDLADRAPRALADGESLTLGRASVRWLDTPHLPHGWDCGYLFETTSGTLFCGDLFTQAGSDTAPLTTSDILAPSESMRSGLDYFSHGRDTPALLEKLARLEPTTLACMHGSAWTGDGASLRLGSDTGAMKQRSTVRPSRVGFSVNVVTAFVVAPLSRAFRMRRKRASVGSSLAALTGSCAPRRADSAHHRSSGSGHREQGGHREIA
jgi:glyoxylase-like metal-dependent hydrolase (beta-lactamase superfamily II)